MSKLTLATNPDTIQQGSGSILPWDIDFSAHLGVSETISSGSATLTDLRTGADYAAGIQGTPTVPSSQVVRVVLQNLVYGHHYRLVTKGTVSATKTPVVPTIVEVPC